MDGDSENKTVLSNERIDVIGKVLSDEKQPLAARFRALFILRNVGCDRSVEWICKNFNDPSALLKHEMAYCLGQTQNTTAIPVLSEVLKDENQETIVRHEAGEALGAIGDPISLPLLEKFKLHEDIAISQTCDLAVNKIKWSEECKKNGGNIKGKSPYASVDPAPACSETDVKILAATLIDTNKTLWDRYQAMFALRNIATDEAVEALGKGLYCPDSALFRHEVAYVLGQIQSPKSIESLRHGLEHTEENHMVRHECAEALGAIATEQCEQVLNKYLKDSEQVVKESCIIALDMVDYENSESFQYTPSAQ